MKDGEFSHTPLASFRLCLSLCLGELHTGVCVCVYVCLKICTVCVHDKQLSENDVMNACIYLPIAATKISSLQLAYCIDQGASYVLYTSCICCNVAWLFYVWVCACACVCVECPINVGVEGEIRGHLMNYIHTYADIHFFMNTLNKKLYGVAQNIIANSIWWSNTQEFSHTFLRLHKLYL